MASIESVTSNTVRYRTRTLVLNYKFVPVPASCGDGGGKKMRLATPLEYCCPVQFVLSLLANQNAHSRVVIWTLNFVIRFTTI